MREQAVAMQEDVVAVGLARSLAVTGRCVCSAPTLVAVFAIRLASFHPWRLYDT